MNVSVWPVAVFTALPWTVRLAVDVVADVFVRSNGFAAPFGNGPGVHVWPDAGAAEQAADEKLPGSIEVRSNRIFGAAVNVMNPASGANGKPGVSTRAFRSRIVPIVLFREAYEPVLPLLLTTKVPPGGGPTGGWKSIKVAPTATDPLILNIPSIGAADRVLAHNATSPAIAATACSPFLQICKIFLLGDSLPGDEEPPVITLSAASM